MIKKFKIIFLGIVLIIGACSHPQVEGTPGFERRSLDDFYSSAGTLQYFLSEIPLWSRTSVSGHCHQKYSTRYLDVADFMASFSTSYRESLNFQYSFNIEYKKRIAAAEVDSMSFRDQERLFFDVYDRVQSNIFAFQLPRFKRVHLIWVDPILKNSNLKNDLKKWMQSEMMNLGHPVLISFCLEREELESFRRNNNIDASARLLSYEVLSPFSNSGKLLYKRFINLNEFLEDKEIHLFIPKDYKIPQEIEGHFELHFY